MRRTVWIASWVGFFALPSALHAQATYELIYRFRTDGTNPVGRLVEAPDGSLYGTTYLGGRYDGGAVFALRSSADGSWSSEIVHHFQPEFEGGNPWGSLTLGSDGSFYGQTYARGPTDGGTVFRMSPSGEVSVLHAFSGGDDGSHPVWRLLEARDGNFYGSTCGAHDSTVFRIAPSGSFTPFVRLPWYRGCCPITELKEGVGGFLYGQATYCGPYYPLDPGAGALFRIDPRASPSSPLTLLHAFSGPDGAQPVGGLVAGPGRALYGTTYQGGPFGKGLIFRQNRRGAVTTVHAFRGDDGAHPYGSLLWADDGALYGTASEGGMGFGTLFKIDAHGQFRTLHAFTGADGRAPVELMQARDGNLYGVTYYDGPAGGGTAFRLGPSGAVETLHAFSGLCCAGKGVIEADDGSFYGTSSDAVFKLSPARELTVVHKFESAVDPSGLFQASDGLLYGTTKSGGTQHRGTVFRIGTTGGYTVLHSFADDSLRSPEHGVVQGSDGQFYGTAGGTDGSTVFRLDASGNLARLHTFTEGEGSQPSGPLVEGVDGRLYGAMQRGGASDKGTAFAITKNGDFTLLHTFGFPDGDHPWGELTRAADGRLYGVTHLGGSTNTGTIFRLDAAGGVATLYSFARQEGFPTALLAGRDGVFYAVTNIDWLMAWPGSRFFRFTDGALTVLYSTADGDGLAPSRLIQGSDGSLYGTMEVGYPDRGGVFRLRPP